MVNIDFLKTKGVSTEAWKGVLSAPKSEQSPQLQKFLDRMWTRASNGINGNMANYKQFLAIDNVWDTPLQQITPSLIGLVANRLANIKDDNYEEVNELAKSLGFKDLIIKEKDAKTGTKLHLNVPAYFEIVISLVKAYVTARWAKLDNDRRTIPVLKYEPIHDTLDSRIRCDAITDRVQRMSEDMGYNDVRKTSILKMLLYGTQLKFIETEWFSEKQTVVYQDGTSGDQVVKEGLNYYFPHPTKQYWDRAYPITAFNTDTGPQFAGYWRLLRYGDIALNKAFFNLDQIGCNFDWFSDNIAYFSATAANTMSFPSNFLESGAWKNDAQSSTANWIYNETRFDASCLVVEHHEKIIPSDVGLGDYSHPVWARFVLAGNGTVIYAAPLPHCGVTALADIYDPGRLNNSSMALELIPFQDTVTNLLAQAIVSAKENLDKIVLFDSNIIDEKVIAELRNKPEWKSKKRSYITLDLRKLRGAEADIKNAVLPLSFPIQDGNQCLRILDTVLNLLERVHQISPMEVGSAASHEQTTDEISGIREATSNRLQLTGNSLDSEIEAWKRQLFSYLMAYGEDDMYVQIGADVPVTNEYLQGIGFTAQDNYSSPTQRTRKMATRKTALAMESFAASRDGAQRSDSKQVAGAMSQIVIAVTNNPMLMQVLGPEQAVELLNQVGRVMGLPKDFKLKALQPNPQQQQEQQEQQAGQDSVHNALKTVFEELKRLHVEDQKTKQAIDSITQILQNANPTQQPQPRPTEQAPAPVVSPMVPDPGLPPGIATLR